MYSGKWDFSIFLVACFFEGGGGVYPFLLFSSLDGFDQFLYIFDSVLLFFRMLSIYFGVGVWFCLFVGFFFIRFSFDVLMFR